MSRFSARHGLLVAAAATLLVAPSVSTATASATDEGSALPAEVAAAVQRDLGLSPQEYLDRADLAQRLGAFADEYAASHDDYAGSWLDDQGRPVVAVTTEAGAEFVAAQGFAARQVAYSRSELEAQLQMINSWINALPPDLARAVRQAAVDTVNNEIVVSVADTPIGQALNLPTLLPHIRIVFSPEPAPKAPGSVGGDMYVTAVKPLDQHPEELNVCSFGFPATDAAGNPVVVTAGHCNPLPNPGAKVYLPDFQNLAASREVGSFTAGEVGGRTGLDWAVISLNGAGRDAGLTRPAVRGIDGTELTITGVARPVPGAPMCKTGSTSGVTCGIVLDSSVTAGLMAHEGQPRKVTGFTTSACTLEGDSGGAITTGTLALGISSGSNTGEAPNCGAANLALATNGGTASLSTSIADIEAANPGLHVRTVR